MSLVKLTAVHMKMWNANTNLCVSSRVLRKIIHHAFAASGSLLPNICTKLGSAGSSLSKDGVTLTGGMLISGWSCTLFKIIKSIEFFHVQKQTDK